MSVTPEEIARLRRLLAGATPGPWHVLRNGRLTVAAGRVVTEAPATARGARDTELVSVAVSALPSLLDEIERTRERLQPYGSMPTCDDGSCKCCSLIRAERLRAAQEEK